VKGDAYSVGRWITRKYAIKIVMKHAQMWNYATDGCEHLCHESIQPPKSITPIYSNERRISETDNVPTASSIFLLFSFLNIKIKIFYW
jgi:hypothetical protein